MSASATQDDVIETLPLDVLEDAAQLKAEGMSWPKIAEVVHWDFHALRRACRNDPRFRELLDISTEEIHQQGEAEAYTATREGLRSYDEKVRMQAAERLLKYHTAKHANQTRERVAQINNEAKIEVARIKASPSGDESDEQPQEPTMTPEQQEADRRYWEREEGHAKWMAAQVGRQEASVFLWGGCHKLGETRPDETDTPLIVIDDHTIPRQPGEKSIFWVIPYPSPVEDWREGPFLEPPGCRPAVCPTKPEEVVCG